MIIFINPDKNLQIFNQFHRKRLTSMNLINKAINPKANSEQIQISTLSYLCVIYPQSNIHSFFRIVAAQKSNSK